PTSLARGLDRIDAILTAVEHGARTTTSIAGRTGLHRTTTHRLVKDLVGRGYLAHTPSGYVLGPRILRLATTAMRELPLRSLAEPVLQRLSESTGESTQLYVLSGDRRICVAAVQSGSELRTIVEIGSSLPLTAGSSGKVFLAYLPPPVAASLIAAARPLTERTPTGEKLEEQVILSRKRGWAMSSGERELGVGSVSAPILDRLGALLGVISVSAPVSRLTRGSAKRYVPAVTSAAKEIERMLGSAV
ncbi:MAG: IclR family transcriptional regulator, partial [Actinobacteria bacterium]|nr:IclR family transcriptional regulator [Actinomycetota bacterium]